MADKIGSGIIYEQPPSEAEKWAAHDEEKARLTKKRDDARWYIVMGVGMMFAGSFNAYFAVGGVFMAIYGGLSVFYWSRRLAAFDDPWDDPEIDAWEDDEFGKL